jgi:hypothetical protein
MTEAIKDHGTQPLDTLMIGLKLKGEDLVKRSSEQLTFKQVRKARMGQRVTPNIQQKILNALNRCVGEGKYSIADLFNY